MGDTRAPATRTEHPDLHEVVDNHSEDEDYDPEADEVESFDDHVDDLFVVHEVEQNGVTSCMKLTVKEALALPPGKKIVLQHNRKLQQVGQAAGLLSEFLGTLGDDFQQLPICETSWKTTNKAFKEHAFDQVKVLPMLEIFLGCSTIFQRENKAGIVQRIGRSWRNTRNHLFHKVYDKELTFEENLKCKPSGIDANHWKWFIEYRLKEDTQGRAIGRGEIWTMSHKKNNGSYMNEDARVVGEVIEHIESQDASSKEFSQNDSLAQVLEKEHPGRVRGLGFGPYPTQCFRNIPQHSDFGVQIEEYQIKIVKLKAMAAELKAAAAEEKAKRQRMEAEAVEEKAKMKTMKNLLRYIIQQQGGNLPPEIPADLDSFRSVPTSSHAR
ncbi:hypothetical protein Ahy_B10g101934 [Arachis hypogaea]|uniref:Transposase, Ptta/En/Spm, plant n=1 Tax=Arachis hypogaea TaxID=3818 RepID=A0A444X108_ARAHY|nr:hypothetical protein Ahy_B10g101934 [Arachis hypogaea]